MRKALIGRGEIGSEIARLHFRARLAEALMKDEQSDEGLAVVNEALSAGGTLLRIATYDTQTKNTAGDLGNSPKDRARAA
jgi:hypothetical protein